MTRGVHGEKIVAAIDSEKVSVSDKVRLQDALNRYDKWIKDLNTVDAPTIDELVSKLVNILNEYKYYIDVELIFDSKEDFLYRQKGQLKLDNTVIEEFLPIFAKRCIEKKFGSCDVTISSQIPTFSSVYFASSLSSPGIGGGINIKSKDQDFSMSRTLYIKSSYSPEFNDAETVQLTTHLGYILAELKTNLDKTMFQEASAMTPISTSTTDIDEILVVRKAKRINSNVRKSYNTYVGRKEGRTQYTSYLRDNPYASDIFKRFIEHIISQMQNENLVEESVLSIGYF